MAKKAKGTLNREELSEDWCFVCKDGGELQLCEYKQCLKAYHSDCLGKDKAFYLKRNRLTCKWHYCFNCLKNSKFHCFCCPNSVCQRCFHAVDFVLVRESKGFCRHCLKLALLIEEGKEVDSEGETVDFKDGNTYEGLFSEYWDVVKKKEGLTLEVLQSADARFQTGGKYKSDSFVRESNEKENMLTSDYNAEADIEKSKVLLKRKRTNQQKKSKKREFVGWGSKSLIDFLASIGKDTNEKLSQHEVSLMINGYINDNRLFCTDKKKKVLCDEKLKSIFGRKTVNRNKIYDLLECHFLKNLESSNENFQGYNSEDNDERPLVTYKRQKKLTMSGKSKEKVEASDVPAQACFASVIPENIKLVYLKRSLVEKLLKIPETFEGKVVGSFVRVKSDANDCLHRNFHQLVQVTGIKRTGQVEKNIEILLQVSNMVKDISISMLSNGDFSEEECEALKEKMKSGLFRKLTVAELEQRAAILHEDITKHWIERELALLQNLIDRANEKGWRREYPFFQRRQLLLTESEQSRLLESVPKVIADIAETELAKGDVENHKQQHEISPGGRAFIHGYSTSHIDGNRTACATQGQRKDARSKFKGVELGCDSETDIQEELAQSSYVLVPKIQDDIFLQKEPCQTTSEDSSSPVSWQMQSQPKDLEHKIEGTQEQPTAQCIEIGSGSDKKFDDNDCDYDGNDDDDYDSNDDDVDYDSSDDDVDYDSNDDDDGDLRFVTGKQELEDFEEPAWHFLRQNGERKGPHSLSLLKRWSKASTFALKFKIWKTGQSEANAIPLKIAIGLFLNRI
ncbi:hypothetical protein NMG60_11032490 [Bertholletia excelsa]